MQGLTESAKQPRITDLFVRRPVVAWVISAALVIVGIRTAIDAFCTAEVSIGQVNRIRTCSRINRVSASTTCNRIGTTASCQRVIIGRAYNNKTLCLTIQIQGHTRTSRRCIDFLQILDGCITRTQRIQACRCTR